jgi:hypothetical protein
METSKLTGRQVLEALPPGVRCSTKLIIHLHLPPRSGMCGFLLNGKFYLYQPIFKFPEQIL